MDHTSTSGQPKPNRPSAPATPAPGAPSRPPPPLHAPQPEISQPGTGANDGVMDQFLHMMAMQQQVMEFQQQQFQAFMEQQTTFQRQMFEQQSLVARQKHSAEPPKFHGRVGEDMELWLFAIEEHLTSYARERDRCDSRFVDIVVPFLGPDEMSWYREFKNIVGDQHHTWFLFKQQIRMCFHESDFEFKLLSKLHDPQVSGTQYEYTSKFMFLLSQSSLELPEMVKHWLYQQNLSAYTSSHI